MSDHTSIEWTDATWNPLRGCTRVSEGCRHCYAERVASRFSDPGGAFEGFARRTEGGPRWTGRVELMPAMLGQPRRWRQPRHIFVNSMSDLFHESLEDRDIAAIFAVIAETPRHTYQALTKRPDRLRAFATRDAEARGGPLANLWLGVSVEDQEAAEARLPQLADTPAAIRFLSCEPLLGPLELDLAKHRIHWIIVGAESGPGARPMEEDWVRALRDQANAAGVAFFYKQNAVRGRKRATPPLDGRTWTERPAR